MAKPNVELKMARMSKGISQLQLSELTGINNSKLSMLENGWRQPTPFEIQKIERVLKVSLRNASEKAEV